nr:MAG TPA: hypothetical protein [Caudoviricetes sp.]
MFCLLNATKNIQAHGACRVGMNSLSDRSSKSKVWKVCSSDLLCLAENEICRNDSLSQQS